jgi:amino acid transporter
MGSPGTAAAQRDVARDGRDESPRERRDRELIELLNELRIALPGVQVLFAFLLTVPFSQRFTTLTEEQRGVFFATFVATALATALLMTPTAYHRVRFRRDDKERLLRVANTCALAGLGFLIAAVGGCVFLIADVMFDAVAASLAAGVIGATYAFLWFVLPLSRRLRESVDEEGEDDDPDDGGR